MTELRCTTVPAEAVIDLRHAVLRQGLPRAAAVFDGDDAARHYAVVDGDQVVVCLSMMLNPLPAAYGASSAKTYQLRGMASAEQVRGQGFGRQLMEFMESDLEADVLWCNARRVAIPFYEKCAWQIISEEFEIPQAGPHVVMKKDMVRA